MRNPDPLTRRKGLGEETDSLRRRISEKVIGERVGSLYLWKLDP